MRPIGGRSPVSGCSELKSEAQAVCGIVRIQVRFLNEQPLFENATQRRMTTHERETVVDAAFYIAVPDNHLDVTTDAFRRQGCDLERIRHTKQQCSAFLPRRQDSRALRVRHIGDAHHDVA